MNAIAAQQIPPIGTLALDHIAHFVPDLGPAADALAALGFVVTARSDQSTRTPEDQQIPAGAANRCVMLESGYLEFLTPTAATPVGTQLQHAIARHVGMHLIAMGTPHAEDEHQRLHAHGFDPLPLVHLQRAVLIEAVAQTVRFHVVRVPPEKMPEGRMQFVQQITPEHLWRPAQLAHRNGVLGLHAAFIVADAPDEVAARYAQFCGLLPRRVPGFIRLDTPRGHLYVGSQSACQSLLGHSPDAPSFAGCGLRCSDPGLLVQLAKAAGCAVGEPSPGLFAITLPAALGSTWLVGTQAAWDDWGSPGCG